MKRSLSALLAGGITLLALLFLFVTFATADPSPMTAPSWQAVTPQVVTGKAIRLEVRLIDAAGKPLAVSVIPTAYRLDMGPDGMAGMTAPLHPVASTQAGVLAFEADISMAGHWALTLQATAEGEAAPVSGHVVFTASEQHSDASPATGGARRILYYRNPMGLADTSPVPRKDSMGMDYIPVYADEAAGTPGTVTLTPEKIQRSGVRTEAVARHSLSRTILAAGTVAPDESRLSVVTARFSGFVEQLLVPAAGVTVQAGQPLARVWIESPELLIKETDFLVSLHQGGEAADTAARNLRQFGVSDSTMDELRHSRRASRSIIIDAPSAGMVLDKPATVGMHFSAGDPLYKVADLSNVWIVADIAERDLALIRPGQEAKVTVDAYPDKSLEGRISLIYPEIDSATRSARVRIEAANPQGLLRAGLYAEVAIATAGDPVIVVPDSAVIDDGSRQTAFVAKGDGVFEPRALTLGQHGDDLVEVKSGLAEGEQIVTRGNFLIDAESNLRLALSGFAASDGGKP